VINPVPYDIDSLVPVEVNAGTLIAFSGLLPHWSAPNTSKNPRLAYTLHVIDGTADYLEDNWLQRGPSLPLRGFT
jgi:phytanoyl-CoA hydroxylase